MGAQAEAAEKFQGLTIARSDAVVRKALRLWEQIAPGALDAGWAEVSPALIGAVSAVVAQNAASAGRMVASVGAADGVPAGDVVVPNAWVGVDSSGRDVEGLLFGAVTTTKTAIGSGLGVTNSMLAGASYLAAMTKTVVADMARSSAATAATGRGYVRYIRMVNPGACSRCAILAGSDRFSKPFQRHPACRCTSVPVSDLSELPDGLIASPEEHFDSLTRAEQDRIYTKAGAEAIRLGADPRQVASARRGASGLFYSRAYPAQLKGGRTMQRVQIGRKPDGSPIMGFTTLEGTTKRGNYGRIQRNLENAGFVSGGGSRYTRTRRSRLMPESIMEATEDPDVRRMLLRDAGYLDMPIRNMSNNLWVSQRLEQQRLDRIAADTFYRSLGINLY